jgi:3-oxoacyl-[acyl-carrier protein] reductase
MINSGTDHLLAGRRKPWGGRWLFLCLERVFYSSMGGRDMANKILAHKVALVTGGSRGIGRAISMALAAQGASVVVNWVADQAAAQAVVDEVQALGGQAIIAQADVAQAEAAVRLFASAESRFGPVDILVNNAGLARYAPIREVDEQDFDRLFAVNVKGTFLTCREAARRLAAGGTIVNITSTVTRVMLPRYGVYAATKAAVEQLTRVLAKELGERQITVNAVAPGPTDTALFRHGKSEEQMAALADAAALQRLGLPEDIADVVVFLASPSARWISGQCLPVNGGFA